MEFSAAATLSPVTLPIFPLLFGGFEFLLVRVSIGGDVRYTRDDFRGEGFECARLS